MHDRIIHNGDHAEFEIEHAGTPPHERPDWPMPSFDARDWAAAFVKINPTFDEGTALAWFAGALMRGFDEANARHARKEVMPHPDTVQSSGQNTTPPQASEPGVTDELLAELEAPAAIGGTTSEDWWEEYDPLHLDAATEIRRLRALVAEQAARIAALEAGELVRIVRQFRDFARSGAGFSYPPGSLQAIDAALAKLGGPDGKTE